MLHVVIILLFSLLFKRQDAAPSRIPRSTSIDSMVDLVWNTNETNDVEQEQINPSKNLTVSNETPSRRESLLSPRRTVSKQIRGINGKFVNNFIAF